MWVTKPGSPGNPGSPRPREGAHDARALARAAHCCPFSPRCLCPLENSLQPIARPPNLVILAYVCQNTQSCLISDTASPSHLHLKPGQPGRDGRLMYSLTLVSSPFHIS